MLVLTNTNRNQDIDIEIRNECCSIAKRGSVLEKKVIRGKGGGEGECSGDLDRSCDSKGVMTCHKNVLATTAYIASNSDSWYVGCKSRKRLIMISIISIIR